MTKNLLKRRKFNFTEIGILLGTAFPLMSILIDFFRLGLPFSATSIIQIFTEFPLHWIILSAPLILGLVFHYFGKQFQRKENMYIEEKIRNQQELARIESFLAEIEAGDLTDRTYTFLNPNFAQFLRGLKDKLREQKDKEEKRAWAAEGLAMINEILTKDKDVNVLFDEVLHKVVTYTRSNQGSLFVFDPTTNTLDLKACYAYDRKKFLTKSFGVNDGLIGACFMEKETIVLKDIPKNYIRITSGLGEAPPGFIAIVPIKNNEIVEGVLEIASFSLLADYKLKFIERVTGIFASVIRARKTNEETKRLLKETQLRAEEFSAHEEELRQNMEELQATQEAMERKANEYSINNQWLNAILDTSEAGILTLNANGIIQSANKAIGIILKNDHTNLVGEPIAGLFSDFNDDSIPDAAGFLNHPGVNNTLSLVHKNGSPIQIVLTVHEVIIGSRKCYTCFMHDVTKNAARPISEKGKRTILKDVADNQ